MTETATSEQGRAVEAIRLLERRILWLEGRYRAFQDAYESMVADENREARVLGERPREGVLDALSQSGRVAAWRAFDSERARTIGRLIRTTRGALDAVQTSVNECRTLELPEAQRTHVEGLAVRANRAMRGIRGAHDMWRAHPASRFDTANDFTAGQLRQIIPDWFSYAIIGTTADVMGPAIAQRADEIIEGAKRLGGNVGDGLSWYAGFINRWSHNALIASDYAMLALVGVSGVGALFLWISISKRL